MKTQSSIPDWSQRRLDERYLRPAQQPHRDARKRSKRETAIDPPSAVGLMFIKI